MTRGALVGLAAMVVMDWCEGRFERKEDRVVSLRVVTIGDLQARLAEYEKRYGIPSDRLVEGFTTDGELQETGDFLAWSALFAAVQSSEKARA